MRYNEKVYELVLQERIEELQSDAFLFRHKKSGARIAILSNDDENKVFSIGFRTPPPDSSGVPHILEHSVLCGSAKYPAKDPFIELAKGSLNTFLNAMTYPDKTVYPIASCNDVDFKNIMDVYMDAVFNPNIYTREQIFMQEGWHYEMEDLDGPITYNGVVYNEMKGAFSSPDDVLTRYILNSLYPDTSYATESGGDPEFIPSLSYEEFLAFHKKLYHPSNSYIYLYGNCDMSERLDYLDSEYLGKYDYLEVDSEIKAQPQFSKQARIESSYSVTEEDGTKDKTYLSYNMTLSDSLDRQLYIAFQVLDYALLSAPGAPVRQALLDAGIGEDVYSYYECGIRQPLLSIIAKNTETDKEQEFLTIIRNVLQSVVKTGINRNSLKAGINSLEFKYREADFGRFPKGLMYGLNMLDSWMFDETKPFIHLRANDTFKFLKDNIETGYFESLIEKYMINNAHTSVVVLKPEIDLTVKKDKETAARLAKYKESLTKEQQQSIIDRTAALKKYQEEPSPNSDLETIPLLAREDIGKDIQPLTNTVKEQDGVKVLHHKVYTNGIGYLNAAFNIQAVPDELLPYVGLLTTVLGYIDTTEHTYDELSNEIDINTGGIIPDFSTYQKVTDSSECNVFLSLKCKALFDKFDYAVKTILEIMYSSKLDDEKRLKEILAEMKSRLEAKLNSSGHAAAIGEAMSQFSVASRYIALTSGIPFYSFINDIYENFDSKKKELCSNLQKTTELIFSRENMVISFTADDEGYNSVVPYLRNMIASVPAKATKPVQRNFIMNNQKTAYKTAAQVLYVAQCGNFAAAGYKYTEALKVLKTIMAYEYLWKNIRVMGGAYGCMSGFGRLGASYFVSYRDPNLGATLKVYDQIPEYLKSFDADEREMTKYVIGTISEMDTPLTPSSKGARSFDAYMRGITEEDLKRERMQVLTATAEDMRNLSDMVRAVLDQKYICVIGNSEKIMEEAKLFDVITTFAMR